MVVPSSCSYKTDMNRLCNGREMRRNKETIKTLGVEPL